MTQTRGGPAAGRRTLRLPRTPSYGGLRAEQVRPRTPTEHGIPQNATSKPATKHPSTRTRLRPERLARMAPPRNGYGQDSLRAGAYVRAVTNRGLRASGYYGQPSLRAPASPGSSMTASPLRRASRPVRAALRGGPRSAHTDNDGPVPGAATIRWRRSSSWVIPPGQGREQHAIDVHQWRRTPTAACGAPGRPGDVLRQAAISASSR